MVTADRFISEAWKIFQSVFSHSKHALPAVILGRLVSNISWENTFYSYSFSVILNMSQCCNTKLVSSIFMWLWLQLTVKKNCHLIFLLKTPWNLTVLKIFCIFFKYGGTFRCYLTVYLLLLHLIIDLIIHNGFLYHPSVHVFL